jgi:hypothetical protein
MDKECEEYFKTIEEESSKESMDVAKGILNLMVNQPDIAPLPDGGIILAWDNGKITFQLDILKHGYVEAFYLERNKKINEEALKEALEYEQNQPPRH